MRITKTFAITLAVLAVASCGGSSKKAAPAAPPVSLAVATTAAPATAAATTIPAQTLPPTTVAQTTTTMSLQDLEKVVRARFLEIEGQEEDRCFGTPASCDPTAFIAQEGTARDAYVKAVQTFVEHKWVAREPLDDPSYTVVQSVRFDEKRTRATISSCRWNTAVILQPGVGPGGSDITVNDLKDSYDQTSAMVLENGTWMRGEKRDVTRHEGVNACPPKGS